MDNWNPEQYNRFQVERSQPFWDLVAKIDFSQVRTALDIGCGTGELTAQLHKRMNLRETIGIDNSHAMLAKAERWAEERLHFVAGDVDSFRPTQKFDLVFSNAALQWVDGHKNLFVKLINWLEPRGQLGVQMPVNFDHPSHFLANDVAVEMKLKVRQPPLLAPETYAELLWRHNMDVTDVSMKVYLHPLSSGREVVEWTKGTLLTHYQKQLDLAGYKNFVDEYSRRLLLVTGEGPYLYPFKRLFVVARKRPGVSPKTRDSA